MADETAVPTRTRAGLPFWVRRVGLFSWLFIGFLLAVGASALLLTTFSAITVPVVIAVCLAVVFAPAVTWLAEHGLNRSLAAGAVLLGLVGIVAFVIWATASALVDQSDELSENLGTAVDDIKGWLADTPISGQLAD